jgi:hypothetical protein
MHDPKVRPKFMVIAEELKEIKASLGDLLLFNVYFNYYNIQMQMKPTLRLSHANCTS